MLILAFLFVLVGKYGHSVYWKRRKVSGGLRLLLV